MEQGSGQREEIPGQARSLSRKWACALALDAGFSEAGLVALPYANQERDAARYEAWVAAGRAGSMSYLERRGEDGRLTRSQVQIPFPWARSALVCFASYAAPEAPLSTKAQNPWSGWIARYAWTSRLLSSRVDAQGERRPSDYHKVLLKRLRQVDARLHVEWGAFESRAYVDTGPMVERSLAVAAGLGWTGKNTCLIHPRLGSFGFLAVLVTSLEVSETASEPIGEIQRNRFARSPDTECEGTAVTLVADRCGTCTRCIEACPTQALDAPRQLDARRCISYLTIERKGAISEELMPLMGRQVFGCDICQDVCPWNGKALRAGRMAMDAELEPRAELVNPALEWLGSMDEASFEREFNGSPVRRAGFLGLRRNVAIAMGNSGMAGFVPKLEAWAGAADEGVRRAAQWALRRLRGA